MKEGEEIKVLVFDLNGTFYRKSSKSEFYKFILKKRPARIKYLAQMLYFQVLSSLNIIPKTKFKENFFIYLNDFPPAKVEEFAREYWEEEYPKNFNQNLKNRFDAAKRQGFKIMCITGGIELYVKPLFDLYPIDALIGTQVDYTEGKYIIKGLACKNQEKVDRLNEHFNGQSYRLVEAYSDSKEEILDVAEHAFLLKNGRITSY